MRLLIVDDNKDLADCLAEILEVEGHEIDVVYNGYDAIEKYKQNDYELTLLDAKLPDISGIEVFNQLNNMKPDKRIIVMTGFRVEQLLAYGTGEEIVIIRKPVFGELVLRALNRMSKGVILIADNEDGLRKELIGALSQAGREVSAVTDATKLDISSVEDSNVVLFDTQQTVLYDINAYERLKKEGYTGTAIILARQGQDTECEDSLKSIVITGCLFKPFAPEELLDIIGM